MPNQNDWWDASWNPQTGCSPVSEGCANCWAEAMTRRFWKAWGCAPPPDHFKVKFHADRLDQPFRWTKPRRIFVCSMSDWMQGTREQIDRILQVIAACPKHTFITLTKRADQLETKLYDVTELTPIRELGPGDYLPNLWLGVTAENQKQLDERLPILLRIPAAVRFISVEPMLSPICIPRFAFSALRWVILGCESGPKRRPCHLQWMVAAVKQCTEAGALVFVKQVNLDGRVSHNIKQFPKELQVRVQAVRAM